MIIITGGTFTNESGIVELLHPNGKQYCVLPVQGQLNNQGHTQSGLVACGGEDSANSCVTYDGGKWTKSHVLLHYRQSPSSWSSSQHGIILMGGNRNDDYATLNSTERLTNNGTSVYSFDLKYIIL